MENDQSNSIRKEKEKKKEKKRKDCEQNMANKRQRNPRGETIVARGRGTRSRDMNERIGWGSWVAVDPACVPARSGVASVRTDHLDRLESTLVIASLDYRPSTRKNKYLWTPHRPVKNVARALERSNVSCGRDRCGLLIGRWTKVYFGTLPNCG